jgi:hypothetical protein
MLLEPSRSVPLPNTLTVMSDRESYLRNQQAVAAVPVIHKRWSPLVIAMMVAGATTIGLFVATVVSYYNDPQQDGPTDVTLPTATSVALIVTAWLLVVPYLVETRSVGARVRNLVIATVISIALGSVGVLVFVDLGSVVADLLYNVSH